MVKMIKLSIHIDVRETQKTIQRINKSKNWFFEKIEKDTLCPDNKERRRRPGVGHSFIQSVMYLSAVNLMQLGASDKRESQLWKCSHQKALKASLWAIS